jgi:hypothetical protein
MSLNSLQDDMSRRASSMAAMAKRANNPQDIQAIQKSLVAGVQNGSIQPYVGIPLIQELTKKLMEAKAKMAQAMAGGDPMQPQQAPQAPVAQQVMQRAAQEEQGLAALQSNLPQEYAGGGIIAFTNGGDVDRAGEVDAAKFLENARKEQIERANLQAQLKSEGAAPVEALGPAAVDPKSMQGFVKQYQDLMTAIPKGASQTEYENFLKNRSGDAEAAKKQDLNLALIQFGSALAAGKSPRALENLGEAGIKTLPAVQEAYKQRRLADETSLRSRAELDRMSRAEQIEALKGGIGLYGKERELTAEADKAELARKNAIAVAELQMKNKPTDLINFVNDYVIERQKAGDKRPPESIKIEGYQKYPGYVVRQEAITANKLIAGGAQNLTGTGQDITAQTAALNAWGRLMDSRTPEKKEFQALQRQDKKNADKGEPSKLAETYKENWFKNNTPGAPRAPAPPPPPPPPPPGSAGAAPSIASVTGAPPGSKIGSQTKQGWEVKDKDGKLIGYVGSN